MYVYIYIFLTDTLIYSLPLSSTLQSIQICAILKKNCGSRPSRKSINFWPFSFCED